MNWAYVLVFLIAVATEYLWVEAVDAVHRNRISVVVLTAILIPGINSFTVTEYVSDQWAVAPMLAGHALGALGVMLRKVWRESQTGCPTTGRGSRSSDPS